MNGLTKIYEGIYCSDQHSEAEVQHDGWILQRFMNIFYIYRDADALSPEEVEALCRARAEHPSSFAGGANGKVRQLFRRFIYSLRPSKLVEVGAGTNPIFSEAEAERAGIFYVRSDADPMNAKSENVFSGTRGSLPYPSEHFDLAMAIFVLHFKFYEVQIIELHRCLSQAGLFIANVYRRSSTSRSTLVEDFRRAGFSCLLMDDPHHLCHEHQYLLATKDDAWLGRAAQLFEATLSEVNPEH